MDPGAGAILTGGLFLNHGDDEALRDVARTAG